jgi:tetratricopeptide (TPR) repeat protein
MSLSCPIAISKQADLLCLKGNVQESIEVCKNGLQQFPSSLILTLFLAKNYMKQGDWADAEEHYLQIVKRDARALGAWKGLYTVYQELGDRKQLYAASQAITELTSFEAEYALDKTEIQENQGAVEEPVPTAKPLPHEAPVEPLEAVEPQKGQTEQQQKESVGVTSDVATRTLAEIYLRQGLQKEALEIYIQLQSQDPNNVEIQDRIQDIQETIKENSFH